MKLTADDIAYLRMAASRDHYNPDDALNVFNYESSGRPDAWGGKGGKYFGIFQAGPAERAQFGIDTKNPSAKNQIDAFGKFLSARGFKPEMGIMDMYSTVLAGSPGHYNRSDGAGTVAQHVARMQGSATPAASSNPPMDITPNAAADKKTDPIGDLIAAGYDPQKMRQRAAMDELGDYGTGLMQQAFQPAQILSQPVPMMPMNTPVPQVNRFTRSRPRGLLG